MPDTTLNDAIKEAYASTPVDEVVLDTIEIVHPSLANTLYLVRDRADHVLTLETAEEVTFQGVAFRMTKPASGENGVQALAFSIDNVDRQASDFFKAAKAYNTPVELKYRPYLLSDPSTPQIDPPLVLTLSDIRISIFDVSGRATFVDILNRAFATQRYVRSRFPSLGN